MSKRALLSICLLLLLGFIWGSGYSLAKIAMENGVPPLGYSFWQSLGPAILLSLINIKQPKRLLSLKLWPFFFICGLVGIAIPNTNMYFSASHLPAGLLSVLVNTVPIITYPLALMLGQEQFNPWRMLAITLGFIGIILIISPHFGLLDQVMQPWVLLTMISPLAFACCSLFVARYTPVQTNPLSSSAGMLLCSVLLLAPLIMHYHAFYSLMPPFNLAKKVVLLEIVLSSIGYIVFFQLIRIAGPVYYSLTGGVVALTGLFWGYVLFDEHLATKQWLAVSFILISILALSLIKQNKIEAIGINNNNADLAHEGKVC